MARGSRQTAVREETSGRTTQAAVSAKGIGPRQGRRSLKGSAEVCRNGGAVGLAAPGTGLQAALAQGLIVSCETGGVRD